MIILGLSSAWKFNQQQLPKLEQLLNQTIAEATNNYPPNLVIRWQNQQLELLKNLPNLETEENSLIPYTEPLFISWPDSLKNQNTFSLTKYLAIALPVTDASELEHTQQTYNSLIVTNPQALWLNNQGKWQDYAWQDILPGEFVLDKNTFVKTLENWQAVDQPKIISQIKNYSWLSLPVLLIISRLWIGLFNSLVIYFLFKMLKISYSKIRVSKQNNKQLKLQVSAPQNYTWSQMMQICLHILVVAETVNQLSKNIYQNLTLPMFSLTFWAVVGMMVVGYKKIRKK